VEGCDFLGKFFKDPFPPLLKTSNRRRLLVQPAVRIDKFRENYIRQIVYKLHYKTFDKCRM
jgi:hypothetical protein